MKIGIDLDGVVYDSEKDLRIYQELYDMFELKQNSKIDEREVRVRERFDWSNEVFLDFLSKYHERVIIQSNYMPGVKMILNMLKEEGHELIIITARGVINKNIIDLSKQRLEEDNMNDIFNKYYYAVQNKEEVCKKENIDIMIDDSNHNCKKTSDAGIKTIYLKDAPSYDMKENENLKVLYNWGEIYRYLKEIEK